MAPDQNSAIMSQRSHVVAKVKHPASTISSRQMLNPSVSIEINIKAILLDSQTKFSFFIKSGADCKRFVKSSHGFKKRPPSREISTGDMLYEAFPSCAKTPPRGRAPSTEL